VTPISSQKRSALKARRASEARCIAQGGAERNPGYSIDAAISPERAAQPVSPFQGSTSALSETQGSAPLHPGLFYSALSALELSHRSFNQALLEAGLASGFCFSNGFAVLEPGGTLQISRMKNSHFSF